LATPKSLSSADLPSPERIRNYPAFPRAIPYHTAGSPRVPHPSATRTPEGATFDLHALGTPPALILSQDQTLHQFVVCASSLHTPERALGSTLSNSRFPSLSSCLPVNAKTSTFQLAVRTASPSSAVPPHNVSHKAFTPGSTLCSAPTILLMCATHKVPSLTQKGGGIYHLPKAVVKEIWRIKIRRRPNLGRRF
jgi:hypothetical protein